jgi:hypothetical protein
MAELPATIKVGPHDYRILVDETRLRQFERERGQGHYAYADLRACEIVLDPTLPASQLRESLWHEVKHAVAHVTAWFDGALDEEDCIARMSPMELATLRDNPALVAYLTEP